MNEPSDGLHGETRNEIQSEAQRAKQHETTKARSALLVGASGLIGGHLLDRLLDDDTWSRIRILVRRPLGREHPKLDERIADFERLSDHASAFAVDDIFCCLGTTIKKAGSQDAFRQVDYVYPFETARLGAEAGAEKLLVVSSLGAAPDARSFYLQVKGQLEQALGRLPYATTIFLRPSLLLGIREEPRPLETFLGGLARGLWWLMIGPLGRYRPIAAELVADAMLTVARSDASGKQILESDTIRAIAGRRGRHRR